MTELSPSEANLREAINLMRVYLETEHNALDREKHLAENFFRILNGETTVESLAEELERKNAQWKLDHPIATWLYDHWPF